MLKMLVDLFAGSSNDVQLTLEKTDFNVGSEPMFNYTLHLTSEQKALFAKALEKFGQYTVGQTLAEQEYARKLSAQFAKNKHSMVIDLSTAAPK
jgi:hypothetical protein